MNALQRVGIIIWNYLRTCYIGIIYIASQIYRKHIVPKDLKIRCGQVAIVTGGTRGIGLEVVRQLLALQMHVIIGCRNPNLFLESLQELRNEYSNCKVEVLALDVSSLESVHKFAKAFSELNLPLNILINNAGIMFASYSLSPDGFESHFATNYLGHFLLTHLLLPKLKESGKPGECSRIVNVSSCVAFIGKIRFDDLNSKDVYSSHGCYAQSKLAQIMHAIILQEKLQETDGPSYVTVSSVHPGVVRTNLYQYSLTTKILPLKFIFNNAKQGSDTVVYAAVSDDIEGIGGKYYDNCTEFEPPVFATDSQLRQRLWTESCKMVNVCA